MRIHRRSHRPAGSATPSSTSKELPRRSPRLSRHLQSHTAVFTCTTGRASSSPFPRMKLRPNRRHQRGCTLIAASSSSFDLTVLPALGPEPTRRDSIHGGVAGHFLHGVAPSAATSTSVGPAAALALARAAALLLLSIPCLVCSCYCSRCCSCSCSCLRCCSDLATLQSTESTFGSVDFQGVGGLAGVKEEPPAAGTGARRRGTPLSILGFRVGRRGA